jgi:quercetin dioxygenase-like cupin family protein
VPFIDVDQLTVKEPRDGWKGRFFHSKKMTFGYYEAEAGASIHEHAHPNDEVWNVVEGELEITVGSETRRVAAGDAAVVPPNTTHSIKALTPVRAIVVDYPRRESIGNIDL